MRRARPAVGRGLSPAPPAPPTAPCCRRASVPPGVLLVTTTTVTGSVRVSVTVSASQAGQRLHLGIYVCTDRCVCVCVKSPLVALKTFKTMIVRHTHTHLQQPL